MRLMENKEHESMQKLAACRVAVFGIGGVGGYVVEALARSGIGALGLFDFYEYDYVVDAIDTVTGKLAIIENAKEADIPVISSMGAGNKVNPAAFEVADIYETSICPLARVMRRECRKRGIDSLKVVYSKEKPIRPLEDMSISCRQHCICPPGTARKCTDRRDIPGSTAFVPSVAGLIIAGEIVNDLAAENGLISE